LFAALLLSCCLPVSAASPPAASTPRTACLTAASTPGVLTIRVGATGCAAGGAEHAQLAQSLKTAIAALPPKGPSRSELNARKLNGFSELKASSEFLSPRAAPSYYGQRR
jgi:hypothetical protein